MKSIYSHWVPVVLAYLIAFVLLAVGASTGALWPLWVAIALFTAWDLGWVCSRASDRSAQEALDSTTRARTYMSYFVAVYSAALAFFLLRLAEGQQKDILLLIANAGVPLMLVVLPFAMQAVSMLFFPIGLGQDPTSSNGVGLAAKTPTDANLAVLVINVWVEKVTTFCFLYVVVMVGSSLTP